MLLNHMTFTLVFQGSVSEAFSGEYEISLEKTVSIPF